MTSLPRFTSRHVFVISTDLLCPFGVHPYSPLTSFRRPIYRDSGKNNNDQGEWTLFEVSDDSPWICIEKEREGERDK